MCQLDSGPSALRDHGTKFSRRAHRRSRPGREAAAVETDDKIEVIANDLGSCSVPAFTTMFGRLVGEPPQAFRDRRRR